MKIEDYELLLKLNEIGTIRGTAKAILISQPAVTQRLKYIEDYFGEIIFIRTPKNLVLTPCGEIILEHAKRVIEEEEVLKNKLSQSSDEVLGTLSIACSSLISQRFLPKILGKYTNKFPKVTIDLVTGISEDIRRNHKDYHVCIIRGEQLKESTSIHLFDDPLYIFDTEPFPKDIIKERPLISFKSDDSMHELVDNWLYYHQQQIKPLRTMTVDQIETCKQFMKQGIGMAVLPKSVSDSMMDEFPHIALELDGKPVTRYTWLSYQEGIRELPQVDEFIKMLTNETFM
ncbi:LysR family transcriptional regulator [Ornithinibacillus bavariensis]|uniref:LysR family transcriptional regulator n=1 Tax=Ornithinibacillus bavariensis TaxID=545502 RepID=UPI000ED436AA|nr:LysR family transcriptional regulator [Ornithinibacillus sp.]